MILNNTVAAFLLAFPAFFSIVNPLGGAIIFNEVTALQTHAQRVALARRVAVYSTFVMLVALWAGSVYPQLFRHFTECAAHRRRHRGRGAGL